MPAGLALEGRAHGAARPHGETGECEDTFLVSQSPSARATALEGGIRWPFFPCRLSGKVRGASSLGSVGVCVCVLHRQHGAGLDGL